MAKKEKKTKEALVVDDAQLGTLLLAVRKKLEGRVDLFCLKEGNPIRKTDVVETGLITLDRALGIWGFPRGKIIEIHGMESSGKSTLTLLVIGMFQRSIPNQSVLLVDLEHSFDPTWAALNGVETDSLVICQPNTAEDAGDILAMLVPTGKFSAVIIDSTAAFIPRAELEGAMDDQTVAKRASQLSKLVNKLNSLCASTNTTAFFISQIRARINPGGYGPSEGDTSGNAIRFFASLRLKTRVTGKILFPDSEEAAGVNIAIEIRKNKLAPPFRVANIPLLYTDGISRELCTGEACVAEGIISTHGKGFYKFEDSTWHGKLQLLNALKKDKTILERLESLYKERFYKVILEIEENEYESDEDSEESVDSTELDNAV